jgi:hypothetical protein
VYNSLGVEEREDEMADFDMNQLDITKQNVAVEKVLEATDNPRHRYLLQAYLRHRYLESAGRYREILDPALTVEHPHYRFSLIGQPRFTLEGRDQVAALYGHWTATDQCVFYVEDETVAVGDHMIVGRGISYQQTLGSELAAAGVDADEKAMYLTKSQIAMIWPYDDRCRLIGEDVWEFDDAERTYIKLDPADVLTAEQAGKLLEPFIKPPPPFDDALLPG